MLILGIIVGILALAFLVTAHEFGHFIMARKNGVKVNEFGICFPPRAIAWTKGKDGKWHKIPKKDWGKQQKSLVISLNYLPIGGFCAMEGESDADTKKGSFGASSFWSKTKILFGGVAMNWLIAAVIFTILAWTGMPQFLNNQFRVPSDAEITVQPISADYQQTFVRSTWSAPIVGVGTTLQLTGETMKGLGDMLWNLVSGVARQISPDQSTREEGQQALETAKDSVSGPIGIIGYLFPNMVNYGPSNLFFLIALISVSLACMNILPIPALDGGRWFLIAIFRARGKKLDKATEERIVSRAMYVLLILIALVTILDVIRFF